MTKWILEPGHSAAEFRAKHMMITWVRGHFKDIHGEIEFTPKSLSANITIDANKLWTGEPARDKHLLSSDFFDVENHPTLTFESTSSKQTGANDYELTGNLTIRGITSPVTLELHCLGQWVTPYYTESGEKLTVTRMGFTGKTKLNRHEFKVSWNDNLENGGVVVGAEIPIKLDVEALLAKDIEGKI